MVNHFRQRPQYAVLLACLIGLILYFGSDYPVLLALRGLALVVALAVLAIPFALVRLLWRAGSRLKD
jgi:hypothetical protein